MCFRYCLNCVSANLFVCMFVDWFCVILSWMSWSLVLFVKVRNLVKYSWYRCIVVGLSVANSFSQYCSAVPLFKEYSSSLTKGVVGWAKAPLN